MLHVFGRRPRSASFSHQNIPKVLSEKHLHCSHLEKYTITQKIPKVPCEKHCSLVEKYTLHMVTKMSSPENTEVFWRNTQSPKMAKVISEKNLPERRKRLNWSSFFAECRGGGRGQRRGSHFHCLMQPLFDCASTHGRKIQIQQEY